jgi:hypothetical protein
MSEDILDQIDAALADATSCLCGCTKVLTAASPSPWFASEECQARWGARQLRARSGTEKAAGQVEVAAQPARLTGPFGAPRCSNVECGRPYAHDGPCCTRHGGVICLHDAEPPAEQPRCWRCARFVATPGETCEECRPPAAAPQPGTDRVHDAFRAEVIRQGLSEYWVDGVRYVVAPTAASGYRACKERLAPPVDAALESAQVATAKSKNDHVPWWRRMLPGGKR